MASWTESCMALGCRMSNGIMDRVIDGVQQQRGAPLGPPGMQGVGPGRGGGSAPEGGGGFWLTVVSWTTSRCQPGADGLAAGACLACVINSTRG